MRPRVYVGGTWDLFHAGHVELLRRAQVYGDVWVAVNTDEYVLELKGKTPIMDYNERVAVILPCEYVAGVVCNDGNERDLLNFIGPKTIVYANDGSYTRESYLALFDLTEPELDYLGIELLFLPYSEGVSSTDIVNRILQRHRGEPQERTGTPQDAGEPAVPDEATGRGDCACLGPGTLCPCDSTGELRGRAVPCS